MTNFSNVVSRSGAVRLAAVLFVLTFLALPVAAQQPPQPPPGFVSVDEAPPQEQLPAAPLLIGAYIFVVVVIFGYIVSVARRVAAVEHDVRRLETDLTKQKRA
jgi:hypothetical protein